MIIDVEFYLNESLTSWTRSHSNLILFDELVVLGLRVIAFINFNGEICLIVSAVCVLLHGIARVSHSLMDHKRHGAIRQLDADVLFYFLLGWFISNHRMLHVKLTVLSVDEGDIYKCLALWTCFHADSMLLNQPVF